MDAWLQGGVARPKVFSVKYMIRDGDVLPGRIPIDLPSAIVAWVDLVYTRSFLKFIARGRASY